MKNRKNEQSISDTRNCVEVETANSSQAEAAQKIEQSIIYMKQNLDKPLQVAALATQASISPSHYFALFKRSTGCAPIDYFTRLRMRRACEMLDGTDLSVKEIATALGYEDPFYFSRVFKAINRVAPSDYRLAHKSGTNGTWSSSAGNRRWAGHRRQRNGNSLKVSHRLKESANGNSQTLIAGELQQRKVKV